MLSFLKNKLRIAHCITYCSLLANEPIDAMLKARRTGILCKVDMEKAYDHVN